MRPYLLVAAGAIVGASGRREVAELIERGPHGFPLATLLVNVAGCLAIGWCARFLRRPDLWLFTVTGGLGGFTTFSSFSIETRDLLDGGRPMLAASYVAATFTAGLAATALARAGAVPAAPPRDVHRTGDEA